MRGGRGGHRRSHEGNRQADRGFFVKSSPKNGKGQWSNNKRNDGLKNKNTEDKKTPEKSKTVEVKQEPSSEVKPTVDETTKSIDTPKEQTSSRSRSRSPIKKNDSASNNSVNNVTDSNNSESSLKYTGRPGEKKFSGRCRLFVANMNNSTTEQELRDMFTPYGETGEVYINKDKGFGFIRLDYRHNAELAKSALDKTTVRGRIIQVRFATHASAIEVHGLDQYASNEIIEKAMSQFGNVERAVVVCDDRGRSKGYAIVEFEWKKSAQKVLDRFKGEMFVLGRLPKPVFTKPLTQQDEEDGITESQLEKVPGLNKEREFNPRFISPSSYEYQLAQKWKDLYIEEQDKKAKLDRELEEARYKLELEMETALREQEANRIREELARRQEELRMIEEDMQNRRQMAQMPPPHLRQNMEHDRGRDNGRQHQYDNHGPMKGHLRDERQDFQRPEDMARQNEMILRQQAELEIQRGEMLRAGIRPEMIRPGVAVPGPGLLPQGLQPILQPASLPGPRGPPPGMFQMRPQMMPGGPQHGPGRDFSPRGGDRRFDNKRPRRD